MGHINTCLKRTFTIFNIIFAIAGGFIILLTVLAQILTSVHAAENQGARTACLIILYVVGSMTMAIAILGAYGAHQEKRGPLIVFFFCMFFGSPIMIRIGTTIVFERPEVKPVMEEVFHKFLPLDRATEDVQEMVIALQRQMQCCGLFSYNDWNGNAPDSCLCSPEFEEDKCVTVNYSVSLPKSVYSTPCFPILMHHVMAFIDAVLATIFTLAALGIVGEGLSGLMMYQLRHPRRTPGLVTVPAIFRPQPPKYHELQNCPSYPGH